MHISNILIINYFDFCTEVVFCSCTTAAGGEYKILYISTIKHQLHVYMPYVHVYICICRYKIQSNIIIIIICKKMVCRGQLGITTVNNMKYNLSFLFNSCVGRTVVRIVYIYYYKRFTLSPILTMLTLMVV